MIAKALSSLRPNASWSLDGDSIEGLIWLDDASTRPTDNEILEEVERQKNLYKYNEYQRSRALEYPSIAEQFDTLYHEGYDGWKASVNAIKLKYPKPTE